MPTITNSRSNKDKLFEALFLTCTALTIGGIYRYDQKHDAAMQRAARANTQVIELSKANYKIINNLDDNENTRALIGELSSCSKATVEKIKIELGNMHRDVYAVKCLEPEQVSSKLRK